MSDNTQRQWFRTYVILGTRLFLPLNVRLILNVTVSKHDIINLTSNYCVWYTQFLPVVKKQIGRGTQNASNCKCFAIRDKYCNGVSLSFHSFDVEGMLLSYIRL